jgi:hypothetical protein
MSERVPLDKAMADVNLLGAGLGAIETWQQWRSVLKGAFGIALNREEARQFEAVAGSRKPPAQKVRELWCILGRRSGKSRVAAALAVFFAVLVDHSSKLAPGEVGHVLVLAASKDQARTIRRYAEGFLRASPVLAKFIADVTADEIRLKNNVTIAVHPANYRTIRGRTLLACIFDEIAFWRSEESAQPDIEVYRAVLPALSTTGGMLIAISSPYRKSGLLHTKHRDYLGLDDDVVVVIQGESERFNPTLAADIIERAKAEDPESALAEWCGEFRNDLSQFLDDQSLDAAIDNGRPLELPPRDGIGPYQIFVDPSAGRHDAFCIGIAHREGDRIIADVIRGRKPPFDPATVAGEFAALAKEYRCTKVVGDNYSGEWVSQAFKGAGVDYTRSELPKSGLYLEGLPAFSRGAISIPNHPLLIRELRLLERRTARSGKDSVDHGPSGSDDHANVLFGAMYLLRQRPSMEIDIGSCIQVSAGEYHSPGFTGGLSLGWDTPRGG